MAIPLARSHSIAGCLIGVRTDVAETSATLLSLPHLHYLGDKSGLGIFLSGGVSPAHYGVFFLHEMPEFLCHIIAVPRQPLDESVI